MLTKWKGKSGHTEISKKKKGEDIVDFAVLKLANHQLWHEDRAMLYLSRIPFYNIFWVVFLHGSFYFMYCMLRSKLFHCNFHLFNRQEFLIKETMILIQTKGAVICILGVHLIDSI